MIKGIIFDMDGVLVDSEGVHYLENKHVFAQYGTQFSPEDHIRWWIVDGGCTRAFLKHIGLKANYSLLHERKVKIYKELIKTQLRLIPGVKRLLEKLSKQYPLAVCSASYKEEVSANLQMFNLEHYFSIIVGADDVKHSKPNPACYILTATKMGLKPSECLVFEDSPRGVKAAKAAGMHCIAVPNSWTKDLDLSPADLIIDGFRGFDYSVLKEF